MDRSTQTTPYNNTLHKCLTCKRSFKSGSALSRHTKDKHSTKQNLSASDSNPVLTDSQFHKPTYKPPILDDPNCPPTYIQFWNLTAKTRRLPPNGKRYTRFVAPRLPLTMLEIAERVNLPDLLLLEYTSFAQAYDTLVQERSFASILRVTPGPTLVIGVHNSKQALVLSGRTGLLRDIGRTAPVLSKKTLSDETIVQFFDQARCHMLENKIPWDDFSAYYLSSAILGTEIFTKVTNVLHGYPEEIRPVLRNFSCFIQHIINKMVIQESYNDAEARIIQEHKAHLLGPSPNIDHTRTLLQSDSRDLVTKSPYYKQVQNVISDESKRLMIEAEKTNLLHKIIADTPYDATIHELLISSSKYKEITDVPNQELMDTLQRVMVAEEKSALVLSNESPVLLPPIYFNTPPPTPIHFNTPPPNFSTPPPPPIYFNTPPPNFSTPPPNYGH